MSTSFLYHTCGIRGYECQSTTYVEGTLLFMIRQPRQTLRCPRCGTADVTARGVVPRTFRSLPIGQRAIRIGLDVPRVSCPKCRITRQVRIGFADERRQHTRAFARYALELTRMMTIQDVAWHLGVGWDLVKGARQGLHGFLVDATT